MAWRLANALEQTLAFSGILNASVAASWMVLAVILLRFLLKRAPRWIHVALWGLVAVRLLLPISIESVFSLIPSAQTVPEEILAYEGDRLRDSAVLDIVSNPVFSENITVEIGETAEHLQISLVRMMPIWIAGLAVLLLYTAVSYWRLRRKVSEAVILRDNIYQSEHIDSPFVLGVFKPRIYLAYHMNEQDLSYVIAHEQAHIRRRDHWWKPLGFILLTIHWFNLLMWLAYMLLCRDIELACDEKVIRDLGNEQRADYTQALVTCSVDRRMIAACPLAFGEVGVKERVKSVMNYKKPAFWVVVLAVIACMIVAVCFLTDPVTSVRNPWVQEYVPGAEGIRGNVNKEKYESVSEAFAIGADQYDRAVFKNPHRAFGTLKSLYADGIELIQEEFHLPPLSHMTAEIYKTLGSQTTGNSSAASFVSGFLDIYENSFIKEIPEIDVPATKPAPSVTKWFDYLDNPSGMEGGLTAELPEYPGVVFEFTRNQITASEPFGDSALTGPITLIDGMPIWNAYFTDLTGDGLPDICATYTYGSGLIDSRIVIRDYAIGASYEMADRGYHDFSLRLSEEDGGLYVDKRVHPHGELVMSGQLVFKDNCIQID